MEIFGTDPPLGLRSLVASIPVELVLPYEVRIGNDSGLFPDFGEAGAMITAGGIKTSSIKDWFSRSSYKCGRCIRRCFVLLQSNCIPDNNRSTF